MLVPRVISSARSPAGATCHIPWTLPVPRAEGLYRLLAVNLESLQAECHGIQDAEQDEQSPVARDQRRVLEGAADHRPQQVGTERHVRRRDVSEALREHQVGEENRNEG